MRLSPTETHLLAPLLSRPYVLHTQEALAAAVGLDTHEPSNALRVHLSNLKRKLDGVGAAVVVRSIRGGGYLLDDAPEV